MFTRTLYYAYNKSKLKIPGIIRKIGNNQYEDVYSKEQIELSNEIFKNHYIKITPYASAGIVRFLDKRLIDSLQLIIVFETTDKMVNEIQFGVKINLLNTFMYTTSIADINAFEYIPKNTTNPIMVLLNGYPNIEMHSAIHLYRDDYVDQIMELIDNYGFDRLKKEFERYVDIEKPKLIKVLSDKEYREVLYKTLEDTFNIRFEIYKIADKYINELFDLTKNLYKNILSLGQQEALCELDKMTHPLSSYPVNELFESSIIGHTLIIFPYSYSIPIDKLKKYNTLYKLIIVRGEPSEKVYVVMYKEKSIMETNNPDITGFTVEEMEKIRNSIDFKIW